MLEISDLVTHYGNIRILNKISLNVNDGEIVSLIGPNGAGKTTTLKAVSGLIIPTSGIISYDKEIISGRKSEAVAKLGIAHVPEGRRVFPEMSVEENLLIGAFLIKNKNKNKESIDTVYELLPKLYERKKQTAGSLSGGEQQMLAIGRALMSEPKLLLLDEPSMGLAPLIVEKIFEIIQKINGKGTSILLIEQNANLALEISKRSYVIETGQIVLSGQSNDLIANDNVRKAYLGVDF
ncbi:MAG: ABC transporter ATP-binding protein [Bacillota bacterium]|nr:ABC transporter ATP-binding protein [Bacillota bacterium]